MHSESKALMQEEGEVAWDGVSKSRASRPRLTNHDYWDSVVEERRVKLTQFRSRVSSLPNSKRWQRPIDAALDAHRRIAGRSLSAFFRAYFDSMQDWRRLREIMERL